MPNEMYDVGGVLLPRPFKTGRFGHFGLYVRDVDVSARFYQDLLGFRHTDSLPGPDAGPDPIGMFLTYNTDHHAMVLIHASVGRSRSERYDRGVTINQMSFQASTLREIVDAHEWMEREGHPIWRVGRDVPGSNWAVYFTDPDGNTVELFYGMEQIGWDRQSKPLPAFLSFRTAGKPDLPQPAELDEVLSAEQAGARLGDGRRWSETRTATFDVGGVLLPRPFKVVNTGPISLFVADIDASLIFYRDQLGMAVTEELDCSGHRLVFLRTGSEHHSVSLLPIALRSVLGLNDRTTLAGYGVQVGSYRQLTEAAAFLADEGCAIIDVPPELHTGIDFAVHVLDPDGHCVRLYHEMENVGTRGVPLTRYERRVVNPEWPASLETRSETTSNPTFQGPIG